jgi:ABC-type transport system substrate-binding protein
MMKSLLTIFVFPNRLLAINKRRIFVRISPYFALASSIVILLISCQKQAPQKSAGETPVDYAAIQQKAEAFVPSVGKVGGEIILSTFGDPKSFNPITSTETSTSDYTDWMYEGLVKINGVTLKPEPGMAQSWEHSADGLSWTFHIRPGVQWSDGTPFSAYDVEFTFNDLIYNDSINPNSSRDVMSVEGKRFAV